MNNKEKNRKKSYYCSQDHAIPCGVKLFVALGPGKPDVIFFFSLFLFLFCDFF